MPRFRSVIAFSLLLDMSSLGKPAMGLKVRRFGFSFESDGFVRQKRFLAFESDVFVWKKRFCLCERHFRFVKAFEPFRATFSLGFVW